VFNCIASQPIFNTKLEIFGYELLYRANSNSEQYDGTDKNAATKDVLLTAFSKIGIKEITGGKKAFVNFTADLLLEEVPYMLSSDILTVEILEDTEPTDEVLAACRMLKRKGYMLALDDFVYSEKYEPLLQIADIVKIDFIKSGEQEIIRDVKKIEKNHRKILLAEKIETYEMVNFAKSLGFTLFQGYFFCKPTISTAKTTDALIISRMYLLRMISDPDVSFFKLADVIKRDVVLSYHLLKIVNSAYYGLDYTVNGILHAITILGLVEVRKWAALIIFSQANTNGPDELIRMALIRGIFMEKLAIYQKQRRNKDEYFLIGLFSLADRITGSSMESIMEETHLSPEICGPLVTGEGERAELLKIICHIEKAEWEEAFAISKNYGIKEDKVNNFYIEAMKESNMLLQ